jgi:hypothetical protein
MIKMHHVAFHEDGGIRFRKGVLQFHTCMQHGDGITTSTDAQDRNQRMLCGNILTEGRVLLLLVFFQCQSYQRVANGISEIRQWFRG